MTYKIIKDYNQLQNFVDLLEDNSDDERYMLYLMARKKYGALPGLNADKNQLKRIMCHKKDIIRSLEQLEVKEGNWKLEDTPIPEHNLVVYIQPNLRSLKKASRLLITKLVDGLVDGGNLNAKSLFYNCLQTSSAKRKWTILDVDPSKEDVLNSRSLFIDLNKIFSHYSSTPVYTSIKTKNGFHILVNNEVATKANKLWYNSIAALEHDKYSITITSDNMCALPGTTQGGYQPELL